MELLIVLALLGVVAAIALPAIARGRDRVLVARETSALARALVRLRDEAYLRNRTVALLVAPDRYRLTLAVTGEPIADAGETPSAAGVSLRLPGTVLRFTPSGLPDGAVNGTYQFSRGDASRRLVVSRYGRARIRP